MNKNKSMRKRILAALTALLLVFALVSCDVTEFFNEIGGNRRPVGDGSDFVPAEITEVIKTEFESSYADQLSPNERAMYDVFAAASPGEHEFTVNLPEVLEVCKSQAPTPTQQTEVQNRVAYWISNALFAVWLDVPSVFWLETGEFQSKFNIELHEDDVYRVKSISVTVALRNEYADNTHYYDSRISSLCNSLSLAGATDYETLCNINDYLCQTIEYEMITDYRNTVYGALVDKKCVCEGYAHAFKLLCETYGIECVSIFGTGKTSDGEEGHMWNAVRLDEKWYAVDVTWNDTTESKTYFLVGSDTMGHESSFADSHLSENKRGDSKVFALPVLSSTSYVK